MIDIPRHCRPLRAALAGCVLALAVTAQEQGDGEPPPNDGLVRGVVYGPLHEPVAKATVIARSQDRVEIAKVETDETGAYVFEGLPRSWVYLDAKAPGLHQASTWTTPSPAASGAQYVDMRLFSAATIHGIVRDQQGDPIPGAQVRATCDHTTRELSLDLPEVVADAKGRYSLEHVPLGLIQVRASAAGHLFREAEVHLRADSEIDLTLAKGAGREFTIKVAGLTKEQCAEVHVRCSIYRGYPEPAMTLPSRLRITALDAQGTCVVSGLPDDVPLSFVVEGEELAFTPVSHRIKEDMRSATLDFACRTGDAKPSGDDGEKEPAGKSAPKFARHTIRGEVEDDKHKPAAGVELWVYGGKSGWLRATTDKRGRFEVTGSFAEEEYVTFRLVGSDQALVGSAGDTWSYGGNTTWEFRPDREVKLQVADSTRIAGVVKVPRGVSPAGIEVRVETEGYDKRRSVESSARTDADGTFAVGGLPPDEGPFFVVVSGPSGMAEVGPLKARDKRKLTRVKVKLKKPVTIDGVVVDDRGEPLPGARVELKFARGKGDSSYTLTDREGRYAFAGPLPGDYVLNVRVRGSAIADTAKRFELKSRSISRKLKVK